MSDDKKVASIEVTNPLLEHMKAIDLLTLAKDVARDMSLRHQVKDMDQAVKLISDLAEKLTVPYDKVLAGESHVHNSVLNLPIISALSIAECADLKSKLNKAISELDKQASVGSNK